MGFSLIAAAIGNADSATAVATSSTLNIATGDLLVCWLTWEDAAKTPTVSDGGSNSFTMLASTNNNGSYGKFGYRLSGVENATATITAAFGAPSVYLSIVVMQFRPDAGETVTLDQSNTGAGSSASALSGNITTTGTDEVVCGGEKSYAAGDSSAHQIGDVNAAAVYKPRPVSPLSSGWYRILTDVMTDGHAQCTVPNAAWVCNIISFKSVGIAMLSITTSECE